MGIILRHKRLLWLTTQCTNFHCLQYSTGISTAVKNYVPLIGLEIHAQLAVRSKLFTATPYTFAAPPNTQLGLHDVAMPGSMPILNRQCLELALVASIGLNCKINLTSRFDRKHYFYADLPAGYQITQYYKPIAECGYLQYIWSPNSWETKSPPLYTEIVHSINGRSYYRSQARIKRIQIEQDSGKTMQDVQGDCSLIDLNRSDVGLIEIITEPDFNSSDQTAAFITDLSRLLKHLKCCNAIGAFGELRVDVNVSIGEDVANQNPRVEIKNLNSIHDVINSIDYEIKRQTEVLKTGGQIVHETRSYDSVNNVTLRMRVKELTQDYRYIPEPNLPAVRLLSSCSHCSPNSSSHDVVSQPSSPGSSSSASITASPSSTPSSSKNRVCVQCIKEKYQLQSVNWEVNLPQYKKQELLLEHALSMDRTIVLIENTELYTLYKSTLKYLSENVNLNREEENFHRLIYAKELSFWISGHLHGSIKNKTLKHLPKIEELAEFVCMNLTGQIFGPPAVELLNLLIQGDESIHHSVFELAAKNDLLLIRDRDQMKVHCEQVIADHPKLVKRYLNGNKKALKKLVQHLISNPKYTNSNKFNPSIVENILKELLVAAAEPSSSISCDSSVSSSPQVTVKKA
ncbi:unnamed protein product [Trichobilharzia szidati]|nr:unnamed protein product [Trichobilharzia szidati]